MSIPHSDHTVDKHQAGLVYCSGPLDKQTLDMSKNQYLEMHTRVEICSYVAKTTVKCLKESPLKTRMPPSNRVLSMAPTTSRSVHAKLQLK